MARTTKIVLRAANNPAEHDDPAAEWQQPSVLFASKMWRICGRMAADAQLTTSRRLLRLHPVWPAVEIWDYRRPLPEKVPFVAEAHTQGVPSICILEDVIGNEVCTMAWGVLFFGRPFWNWANWQSIGYKHVFPSKLHNYTTKLWNHTTNELL